MRDANRGEDFSGRQAGANRVEGKWENERETKIEKNQMNMEKKWLKKRKKRCLYLCVSPYRSSVVGQYFTRALVYNWSSIIFLPSPFHRYSYFFFIISPLVRTSLQWLNHSWIPKILILPCHLSAHPYFHFYVKFLSCSVITFSVL